MDRLAAIRAGTVAGQGPEVARLVREALAEGTAPAAVLETGLLAAMEEVGRRFERGECYIPELLLAARAMQGAVELLRPHLASAGAALRGRMVVGTVEGDLHDIGKSLVGIMVGGAGYEVIDLGTNVPPARFVEAVGRHRPDWLGLSTLLTTTMPTMARTIAALREAGLREAVRVAVGGAPVTARFAREIGADLYAPTAAEAAEALRAAARPGPARGSAAPAGANPQGG